MYLKQINEKEKVKRKQKKKKNIRTEPRLNRRKREREKERAVSRVTLYKTKPRPHGGQKLHPTSHTKSKSTQTDNEREL
jgi:hypothetical protein